MTDGSEDEQTTPEPGGDLVEIASRRPAITDEATLCVGIGGEVLVFGGLRLVPGGTDISREVARTWHDSETI